MLGVVVPVVAAVYEFGVKGRKRIGYRVQMDTTATDVAESGEAGALAELRKNDVELHDPSLVLLRVENNGLTNIDQHDYDSLDEDKVGLRVRFPGRQVVGVVVTELSADHLRSSFEPGHGLTSHDDVIELPKVPLNRRAHYKVLAALERQEGTGGPLGVYADPIVVGGIKDGSILETRSRTGTPRRVYVLIGFLVVLLMAQLVLFLNSRGAPPLDCAKGTLNVVGSTAFASVLTEAGSSYEGQCAGATVHVDQRGSGEGLVTLQSRKTPDVLAFSDGQKPDGFPELIPRPIALLLFTMVVNPDTGVKDLTLAQIQRLYRGQVRDWSELGGNDLPVRLVSRASGSGTRAAFEMRVLGAREANTTTSDDCRNLAAGVTGVVHCERASTGDVLDTVARIPGAIGYSELGAAADHQGVSTVLIGGHQATVDDADSHTYPFWETEYGYTYGEPQATSLSASFLRYLSEHVGADIVRAHGDRPCGDLANPQLCHPA